MFRMVTSNPSTALVPVERWHNKSFNATGKPFLKGRVNPKTYSVICMGRGATSAAQIWTRGHLGHRDIATDLSSSQVLVPTSLRRYPISQNTPQRPRHSAKATQGVPIGHTTNFHLVLHTVYKNPPDAKLEQLQMLEELTLQRLDELNVDSLITVMFAFARSGYPLDPRIQHRMVAATEAGMASFTPRQLEHSAWSLAAMRYQPSESWLGNFAHALQVNWDAFRPSQLAVTLVQAAACGLTHLPAPTVKGQMPALLRRGMLDTSGMEPGTLAKLIWSASHYQPLVLNDLATPPSAAEADAQAEGPGVTGAEKQASSPPPILSVLSERELLAWWESEGVVETAEPADLVLLLHGMARIGVQPGPELMRRLLAAVMGSPAALAQLVLPQLALLTWSTLKLAEEPPRREWLDGLVAALQQHIWWDREQEDKGRLAAVDFASQGSGLGSSGGWGNRLRFIEGSQLAVSARAGYAVRPADVALVLSSLAGLGGQLPAAARGEFEAYWHTKSHWAALSPEDRVVMSLLGYQPEA